MIEVIPKDNSLRAFEKAMQAFNKRVSNDGFIQELRERRYFRKPSEIAREKKRKQIRNQKQN